MKKINKEPIYGGQYLNAKLETHSNKIDTDIYAKKKHPKKTVFVYQQ